MEHPILDLIRASRSDLVRLYALNGVAMHFANEIEDEMFWCFFAASGLGWEQAVDTFYERVRFSKKQDRTDAAVSAKLTGTAEAATWERLKRRVQELLGEDNNIRNLIGHNPVTHALYANGDLQEEHTVVIMKHEVRQKRAMVERKGRPKALVSEAQLFDYCEQLMDLFVELNQFAREALGSDPMHRHRYSPYG